MSVCQELYLLFRRGISDARRFFFGHEGRARRAWRLILVASRGLLGWRFVSQVVNWLHPGQPIFVLQHMVPV